MEPLLNKKQKISLAVALCSILLFIILIVLLKIVDVKPLGVDGTDIGFASFNVAINNILHYSKAFYVISQITGYLSIAVGLVFAGLLVYQFIKRKRIRKIDPELVIIVFLFITLGVIYVVFNHVDINYRPIKLKDRLEPSFPSSHTLLAIAVLGMSIIEFLRYVKVKKYRKIAVIGCISLMAITVICRFVSGVHWATDILGAMLLGTFYISFFYFLIATLDKNKDYIVDY